MGGGWPLPPLFLIYRDMAKNYGINGRMSGKLGAAVFTNQGEANVAAGYNPKKTRGVSVRDEVSHARFLLARGLAALIGRDAVHMRGVTLKRRAVYLEGVCNRVLEVREGVDGYEVLFTPSGLQLADGGASMPYRGIEWVHVYYLLKGGRVFVTAQVSFMGAQAGGGNEWYLVMVNKNLGGGMMVFKWRQEWMKDYAQIGNGVSWDLPEEIDKEEWQVALMLCPFRLDPGASESRRVFSKSMVVGTAWDD